MPKQTVSYINFAPVCYHLSFLPNKFLSSQKEFHYIHVTVAYLKLLKTTPLTFCLHISEAVFATTFTKK